MAKKKISQLQSATTPDALGTEYVGGVQGGNSRKYIVGTHLATLDAGGKLKATQLPTGVGAGDMQANVYDLAGGGKQVAFLADLAALIDSYGADMIGFPQDGTQFGALTTVRAVLDYIWANYPNRAAVVDPTAYSTVRADDLTPFFLAAGGTGVMERATAAYTGPAFVKEFSGSSYTLTADDAFCTIISKSASPCTIVIPHLADLMMALNTRVSGIQDGAGELSFVCDDSGIVINSVANGVVAASARGDEITIKLIGTGAGRWQANAPTAGTVADTDPPVEVAASRVPLDGATSVIATSDIVIAYNEPIQFGTAKTFTYREGGSNVEVFDTSTDIGTGAGKMEIVDGTKVVLHLTSPATAGAAASRRNVAGAVKDLAGNDCAVVADDTTHNWTVASGSLVVPTVVDRLPVTLGAGGTQSVDLPTLAAGDMVIYATCCDAALSGKEPAGYTFIGTDWSDETTPGAYVVRKTMSGSPDTQIANIGRHASRLQAGGYIVVRGGTVTMDGTPTENAPGSVGVPDAPAYAQVHANALRIAVHFFDDKDLALGTSALVSAGWTVEVTNNTGVGGDLGCSIVIASKPAGGSATDSVDPPALTSSLGNARHRSMHFALYAA